MARPTLAQQAIKTLLTLNPFPTVFDEHELKNRQEWAESDYMTKTSFTDQDKTAQFTISANNVFDLLEKLKSNYEAGRTHATNNHFINVKNGYLNCSIILVKTQEEQSKELMEVKAQAEADYRAEVDKAQADHIASLTRKAVAQAQEKQIDDMKRKQQEAQDALAQAYLASTK